MKHYLLFFLLVLFICASYSGPADNKDVNKDSKSAFGPAFDEIVVESHLTVRRKNNGRQGRTQNITNEGPAGVIKTKRAVKPSRYNRQNTQQNKFPTLNLFKGSENEFGSSAANAQAQAFNSVGPLGSFGASSANSLTQNFQAGANGLTGSAAFSGSQQYTFNGHTIDISFGNGFSTASGKPPGAIITVKGPVGQRRVLNG